MRKNIRAERVLDFYRAFGSEAMKRTVEVRSERHALVVDNRRLSVIGLRKSFIGIRTYEVSEFRNRFPKSSAEREDLEAARVGHGGAAPAHKRT